MPLRRIDARLDPEAQFQPRNMAEQFTQDAADAAGFLYRQMALIACGNVPAPEAQRFAHEAMYGYRSILMQSPPSPGG